MKRQILMRFMTIITVTVLLVIGILSFVTYNYYYVTATDVLKRHANASAVLFANSGLAYDFQDSEATIHDVLDSYAYTDAEIEVLDAKGIPRYSSTGFVSKRNMTKQEVSRLLAGNTITKRYDDPATEEHLLEVTEPVVSFGQTTGALRYTTSLAKIDQRVVEICLAILLLVSSSGGWRISIRPVSFRPSFVRFKKSSVRPIKSRSNIMMSKSMKSTRLN